MDLVEATIMAFKRPDSIPYPSTWATFIGKPHGDREPIHYKIQDLTEEYFEESIKHMIRYFLIRENLCSSSGFLEDEISILELSELWRTILKQRMGLLCLATDPDTGEDKIAGINMTCVAEKIDKSELKFQGKIMSIVWECLKDLETDIDIYEMYNTGIYMTALGLSVAPHYHGDNIGYELLMARTPLCKAAGVPLTVTAFTGPASQYLAKKTGFKTINELDFETYKQNGRLAYPKLKGKTILMAKEIKEDTDT